MQSIRYLNQAWSHTFDGIADLQFVVAGDVAHDEEGDVDVRLS